MKQRHPAESLRVPGAQVSGMRRIAPGGAAPVLHAASKPTQGGATPQAPTPHLARRHVTKAAKPAARARTSRAAPRSSDVTAPSPPAVATSTTIGQAVSALFDDLSFAANQPGSYQRMGGF